MRDITAKEAPLSEARPLSRLKYLVYSLLNFVGIVAAWRYKNRYKICILTLHGVMDFDAPSDWQPLRERISLRQFEESLMWLSQHYHFINMDQALSIITGNERPIANALVLTFDDGYKNNFCRALPVMKKLNIPGTFYVVTGHVYSQEPFWFDRLDFALQSAPTISDLFETGDGGVDRERNDRQHLVTLYKNLRTKLKRKSYTDYEFRTEIDGIIKKLEERSGLSLANFVDDLWSVPASWDEVRSAQESLNVTIGSHSVNHSRLARLSDEGVFEEISRSKAEIEKELGSPCHHFAFPDGSFDSAAQCQVMRAGYRSAVTTLRGMNSVGDDPFELKRMHMPTRSTRPELLAKIAGLHSTIRSLVSIFSKRFWWG